ncbi:MAG: hypothetical protein KC466_16585 [Myxococcales bacterium]|nr:hypothetical protein [Myxococcales bacterium]
MKMRTATRRRRAVQTILALGALWVTLSAFSCRQLTSADHDLDVTGSGVKLYIYQQPTKDLVLLHNLPTDLGGMGKNINSTVTVMTALTCTPITNFGNAVGDWIDDHIPSWTPGRGALDDFLDSLGGALGGVCSWVLNKEKSDLKATLESGSVNRDECLTLKANPWSPVVGSGPLLNWSYASASASKCRVGTGVIVQ